MQGVTHKGPVVLLRFTTQTPNRTRPLTLPTPSAHLACYQEGKGRKELERPGKGKVKSDLFARFCEDKIPEFSFS